MGAGDCGDLVAQLFDQILKVESDQGLILDDQHFGADLRRDFPPGLIDQIARLRLRAFERLGDFLDLEGFDRAEKKGDPGRDRNGGEVSDCGGFGAL